MAYAQPNSEVQEHGTLKTIPGSRFQPRTYQAATVYQREDLMNLSGVEVIKRLYDVAILACKKDDMNLAHRAINELIVGLDFQYEDIAVRLFQLYQYSKDCLRAGKKEEAINTLEELRSAWAQAFQLK